MDQSILIPKEVIGKRIHTGRVEYLVRWEKRRPCWVALLKLGNAIQLVERFEYKVAKYGDKILGSEKAAAVREEDVEVALSDCESIIESLESGQSIVRSGAIDW